jgi:redox-sensitive bicupin YhaK (pirin superfamily)
MNDGDEVLLEATNEDTELLILAGPELNEPIARYGPFVMNTREEIHQAVLDYQNGTLA